MLIEINFRNFSEKSFTLFAGFNVVTGDNGAGNFTLQKAIQVAAGLFFIVLPGVVNRKHIQAKEIRFTIKWHKKNRTF